MFVSDDLFLRQAAERHTSMSFMAPGSEFLEAQTATVRQFGVRRLSFPRTAPQILDRSQTVTRRIGWRFLKPGDLVQAVGRRPSRRGRRAVRRLGVLRIRNVRVEPLSRLVGDPRYGEDELPREGLPCWSRDEFLKSFCAAHRLKTTEIDVTRIEFEHVLDLTTKHTKRTKTFPLK